MAGMKQVLRLSWDIVNSGYHNNENGLNDNNRNRTMTESDNKIRLQALALINDCYKYKMDLTINGVFMIKDAEYDSNFYLIFFNLFLLMGDNKSS